MLLFVFESFIVISILPGVIFFAIFISIIVRIIKSTKRQNNSISDIFEKSFNNIGQQIGQMKKSIEQSQAKYCEYCGSKIEKNKSECSSCGAKTTKKVD